jgi:predicted kinase
VPAEARVEAAERARRHFLMALGALAPPAERPCLVLTCGLPGTGKTTIARDLERASGFTRISSDETRKELAGVEPTARAAAPPQAGLYAPEWTERTYAELEQRAQRVLLDGGRPVVDASFREEHRRARFLDLGRQLGVPALLLRCEAAPDVVRRRLAARTGDASDADWRVHVELLAAWERESPATAAATHVVRTDGTPEDALAQALSALAAAGVA